MKYCVFDVECNGLLKTATKIHCLCYTIYEKGEVFETRDITDYEEMRQFLQAMDTLIGHNIVQYDIPVLEKILDIKITARLIDTLAISYYLLPDQKIHGLEYWGERLGTPKLPVIDWHNEPIEIYLERCNIDVKINSLLFHEQLAYLKEIYDGGNLNSLLNYLTYKMDCLKEQEESGLHLNIYEAEKLKMKLEFEFAEREEQLSNIMPETKDKTYKRPTQQYKQDGTFTVHWENWIERCKNAGISENSEQVYTYKKGKPSSQQLVKWLLSLGWEPAIFKPSATEGAPDNPQISLPHGGGICPTVQALYEEHPELENLEGLFMIKHRLGVVKSFLENVEEDGRIYAKAGGFTNTLRLKHKKPIVNLPGPDKPYGKEIRGLLIAPDDDHIVCGSDISGLEDNTKQHYIYFYDPDYVTNMRVPGFDPHCDIAVLAGMMTKDDEEFFKGNGDEDPARYKTLKGVRSKAKTVNFSGTYGAGPAKIAATLKSDISFAKKLHTTYWKRNWAVKQIAKDCVVKVVRGQSWLFNPVAGFWYYLKNEKDRFSTLNQGTGSYVFDTWLRKIRQNLSSLGIKIPMQYHDEVLFILPKQHQESVRDILITSMKEANEQFKLNIEIGVSVDFGKSYYDVH